MKYIVEVDDEDIKKLDQEFQKEHLFFSLSVHHVDDEGNVKQVSTIYPRLLFQAE